MMSLINRTTIITHAKATITLKNDHVRLVKCHIIADTSPSLTFIQVLVTVTCDNKSINNANISFLLTNKLSFTLKTSYKSK